MAWVSAMAQVRSLTQEFRNGVDVAEMKKKKKKKNLIFHIITICESWYEVVLAISWANHKAKLLIITSARSLGSDRRKRRGREEMNVNVVL